MSKKTIIPSGFEAIDNHLGGGYKPGTLLVVRTRETQPDELQDFIINQIKQLVTTAKTRMLIASLGMSSDEFVKCLAFDSTPEQLQVLGSAPFYITEMDKWKDQDYRHMTGQFREFIKDKNIEILVIDGVEEMVPPCTPGKLDTGVIDALLSLAKDTSVAIVASDYKNVLEVGHPRDGRVTEMELKTDINDTVQASILSNEKKTITEDLYGLWKLFNGILQNNKTK